jgi:hypothetical protein
MAERKAVGTGNWSSVATWDGGASIPTTGDIVYLNNFTVTADQDIDLGASGEIRTTTGPSPIAGSTPVAGGTLTVATTRTITANVIAGTTACVTVNAGGVLTHTGTVQGGSAANAHAITIAVSTGVLASHTGDVTAGTASNACGINYVSGTTSPQGPIVGNITGGSNTTAQGLQTSGVFFGPLTINGNVVSGAGAGVSIGAAAWTGTPLLTINGNVTGSGANGAILVGATGNINITVNGKFKAGLGHGGSIATTGLLTVNNPGQIAVEGSDQAGASSDFGLSLNACSCIINGHVVGGSAGTSSAGISLASTIISLTVNGDVTGGSVTGAPGVTTGAFFASGGPFTFNGTVKGGTGAQAYAVSSSSTQGFVFDCIEGNAYGNGTVVNQTVGYFCSADNPNARTKKLKYGTHGMSPVQGRILLIDDVPNNLVTVERFSDSVPINFRQTSYSADFPALADVRHGVVFDSGAKTGTCRVPAAGSVAAGVLVDNTTGTATLTAADVRSAVGMALANLDTRLDTLAGYTDTLESGVSTLVATTNTIAGYTDTVESGISALPKAVWNFDMLANVGDTVPRYSPRNAIRAILRWFVDVTLKKHKVYKEDGTLAFESDMDINATDGIIGDDKGA